MILRKPYALFIKMFKPIHIFMALLTTYLIFNTNRILSFFSEYIRSNNSVVGELLSDKLVTNSLLIIPIVLIIISLIFLGVMFSKQKPVAFYVINIFCFLCILIITIYVSNFLVVMEESIVSIKMIKLYHDLILINMIIEIIIFVLLIIRGFGLNFKKFNFDSDISKFDISASDNEEFELNISVDIDSAKRKRKRKLRLFKYFYNENKLIINLTVIILIILTVSCFLYFNFNKKQEKIEGVVYNLSKFNFKVNKTILTTEGFDGKKITDNYLVVVDASFQSNLKNVSLFLKDISLEVGDAIFYVQTKYSNDLLDIGVAYNNETLNTNFKDYIFVFEIPEKYIESDLFLIYNNEGVKTKVKLNPKHFAKNDFSVEKNIGDSISFKESLGDVSFTINSFEIKDKFLINYNYCIKPDECVSSKEYLKASIDENFDKYVLKLSVVFEDKRDLKINDFYNFFDSFGMIYYKFKDSWYSQTSDFENITSKKIKEKNDVYIGVNSNILYADEIKLIFNIRGSEYEYILK